MLLGRQPREERRGIERLPIRINFFKMAARVYAFNISNLKGGVEYCLLIRDRFAPCTRPDASCKLYLYCLHS